MKHTDFFSSLHTKLLLFTPWIIVLSVIDYRFHYFYWNIARTFPAFQFDFWSLLPFYIFLFTLSFLYQIYQKKKLFLSHAENRNPLSFFFDFIKFNEAKYLVAIIAFFLTGIIVSFFIFTPIVPEIRSWFGNMRIQYLQPIFLSLLIFLSWTEESKERFIQQFFYAISVLGMLSLVQYFFHFFPGATTDFLNRLVWPYVDPFTLQAESANFLSYLFAPFVLLSSFYIVQKIRKKEIPYTEIITFIISFCILLFSKSYTGIAITGFILIIFLFKRITSNIRYLFLLGIIVIGIGVFFTQIQTEKFQILLGKTSRESSLQQRIRIYDFTLNAGLKEHFFTGIGLGQYQSFFRAEQGKYLDQPLIEREIPPHPHNLILTFWSDLGIFGLLGIFLMYIAGTYNFFFKPLTAGSIVFFYFLGHGLIDTPYLLEEINVLFWFFLFLSLITRKYKE